MHFLVLGVISMLKRSFLVCLFIIGIMASAIAAAPQDEPDHSVRQWEKVLQEFNLEVVDEAPAGVTPLVVGSPGQLRKLLAGAASSTLVFNVNASDVAGPSALPIGEPLSLTYSYVYLHESDSSQWPIVFHLYAEVELAGSGSFWQINDCEERAYFTGWEMWHETGGEWAHHHIAGDMQSVKIDGGGFIKFYIWTPLGKIHVFTYWFDMTINYSLY